MLDERFPQDENAPTNDRIQIINETLGTEIIAIKLEILVETVRNI